MNQTSTAAGRALLKRLDERVLTVTETRIVFDISDGSLLDNAIPQIEEEAILGFARSPEFEQLLVSAAEKARPSHGGLLTAEDGRAIFAAIQGSRAESAAAGDEQSSEAAAREIVP